MTKFERERKLMDASLAANELAMRENWPPRWDKLTFLTRLEAAYRRYLPAQIYAKGTWL